MVLNHLPDGLLRPFVERPLPRLRHGGSREGGADHRVLQAEKPAGRGRIASASISAGKWRQELGYAGQPFSAVRTLAEVRRSLAGNVFAFVTVGDYRVACKILDRNAEPLRSLGDQRVLITGVVQGYHVSFDLHRFHHLRLTPYCVIEPVI